MNDKEMLLTTVVRLREYQDKGYMNYYEIKSVIDDIEESIQNENSYIVKCLSEEIRQYYCSNDINCWIRNNISKSAEILECTERTIYRKLKDNSFTLIESRMLEQAMQSDNYQKDEI